MFLLSSGDNSDSCALGCRCSTGIFVAPDLHPVTWLVHESAQSTRNVIWILLNVYVYMAPYALGQHAQVTTDAAKL